MFLSQQALGFYLLVILPSLATADGTELEIRNQTHCKGYDIRLDQHVKICGSNRTNNHRECDVTCDDNDICFSLYANTTTEDVQLVMKNCWKKGDPIGDIIDPCDRRPGHDCWKQKNRILKGIYYQCTCCGGLCNTNNLTKPEILRLVPAKVYITTPKQEIAGRGNAQFSVIAAVFAVVAGLILALAGICAVMLNKRTKHNMLHGSDRTSVETPQSGDTHTTPISEKDQQVGRLSINKMDFNLPELAELKARGRFGCVWRAELPGQKSVAVKIFLMQDKDSWLNEEEIFTTNMVDGHPYILKFIATATRDAGVNKELWLITEFHERGSLSDCLYNDTMSLPVALNFLKTMANGLAFLHEDITRERNEAKGMKPAIAHRDFKSKNVLVKNNMTACIADFGLAIKFIPGQNTGESHGQVGTRRYMAPEVLEGAINFQRDAFLRIDMYAFALVSWEVLTRCSDLPGGPTPNYLLPYQAEFGHQPSIELMTDYVVDQKKRPVIKDEWLDDKIFAAIADSIEECWDNDAEARLPAGCVEVRFQDLLNQYLGSNGLEIIGDGGDATQLTQTPPFTQTPPLSHRLIIVNPAPIMSTNDDTTMQNLINLKRSQLMTMEEDEQALLSKEEIA